MFAEAKVISGIATSFGLGFLYFISAIPAGVIAHAPVGMAMLASWLGYSMGGMVILVVGAPLRASILAKLRINPKPDSRKLFWRIWHRFGLWGLGLVAPVTIGPQATAALALTLGETPVRIQWAISLGALPWTMAFGLITAFGGHVLK